jgi:phosphoribosylformimino-5-aminoimidazole carboxamide ribotide isomerase
VKDEKIAIGGWTETTTIDVYDFIEKYTGYGIEQVFCTDISKDGKLEGPSLKLYAHIIARFPGLHFIASGGVSSVADLHELEKIGCAGAIVGKAIYENRISVEELKNF